MRNYLHIGESIILGRAEIIGIFGVAPGNSGFTESCNRRFLSRNFSEKNKSFILAGGREKSLLYFSRISAGRLCKRMTEHETGGIDGEES